MGTGRVLAISGSLREASTNTALLRTARLLPGSTSAATGGIVVTLYGGMRVLPPYDPDEDVLPGHPEVSALRKAIRDSDALLFCTPEYAGALPGPFANLLDWTVGDDQRGSIYDKPVAWINVSAAPTGAADAHRSLATVLRYVHARVVEAACVSIPVTRAAVSAGGTIDDPEIRRRLAEALATLVAASGL